MVSSSSMTRCERSLHTDAISSVAAVTTVPIITITTTKYLPGLGRPRYVGYPFATVLVFRARSSVRQQYQLATEA
jgi:hypothetical protein